jgi:hypothetical protein
MGQPVTAGKLKKVLARSFNLPERAIAYPYRVAQEEGEIARGKRGKGGAEVSPKAAATTILAVASSFLRTELITTIRAFKNLRCAHTAYWIAVQQDENAKGPLSSKDGWIENDAGLWTVKDFTLPHLQNLPPRHCAEDALSALIEATRDDAISMALRQRDADANFRCYSFRIVFHGPEPAVSIKLDMHLGDYLAYTEEAAYFVGERFEARQDRNFETRIREKYATGDLKLEVEISQQTISEVASLFRSVSPM